MRKNPVKKSIPRPESYQPATGLWRLYRPEKASWRFQAKTPGEAIAWQTKARAALDATIGFQDIPAVPMKPRLLERVDKGDYIREKVVLQSAPGISFPVYLLIPKNGAKRHPVCLAFAGHGYGVKDIVGLWEDGSERGAPDGLHADFAVALCRRGFLTAAPEISCFGERVNDLPRMKYGQSPAGACEHTAALANWLGGSAIGLRVFDGKRLVDYLSARPDADISRLGAMGISGGGLHTLYSAALDPRIGAAVISGYFSTFRGSILAMHHCPCNFIPGMGQFGEMADVAMLVAPRPILVEAGTRDPIFPLEAVRRGLRDLRAKYRVFGPRAEALVEADIFEGRHQINGLRAYDFLWEKLQ